MKDKALTCLPRKGPCGGITAKEEPFQGRYTLERFSYAKNGDDFTVSLTLYTLLCVPFPPLLLMPTILATSCLSTATLAPL